MTKFSDLKLDSKVLRAIEEAGYDTPTPIQAGAIPPALEGRDVLGIAQTGTGKTASFTLPMITLLGRGRARARMPRSLVLCPTRELAAQVAENFDIYAKHTRLTKALLIGGVSMKDQEKLIDRGVDVLIATPGRLLDHFERGNLLLQGVQIMVVDEADRMLDMGFIPDIERIFQLTPFTRQTLFFSATMAPEIERITNTFLNAPERIEVARQATASETITQKLVELTPTRKDQTAKQKRELLRALIEAEGEGLKNAIIFCNRKTEVDIVAKSLKAHGYDAAPIHGDLDQRVRTATLDGFRDGSLRFLIASDVAARGLDIPAVSHIFNFDLPSHAEDYVHRIGRTGRAGRQGTAISIGTPSDEKYLASIESLVKQTLPRADLPEGFSLSDASQTAPRKPRETGRPAGRSASRTRTRDRKDDQREDRRSRAEAGAADPALPDAVETTVDRGRVDQPERAERRQAGDEHREKRQNARGESKRDGQSSGLAEAPAETRADDRPATPQPVRREERREERRDDRRDRRGDRGDRDRGPAVVGMGSHIPDFLMTSFRSVLEEGGASPQPARAEVAADVENATTAPAPEAASAADAPKPKRRTRTRKTTEAAKDTAAVSANGPEAGTTDTEAAVADKPAPKKRATRSRKKADAPTPDSQLADASSTDASITDPATAADAGAPAAPGAGIPDASAEPQRDPQPSEAGPGDSGRVAEPAAPQSQD
ncbi:DEAD/DEAH box helicase [uncultured Paracoccus sp.]|uniref:DEAD/DEAH box helicase n=1 Tax=uncultured Paracoccus sp. TaxID=189685 RepID=UPI0026313BFB|nr:DEAD/DEAH box helicase [uncultured Paracoccus sp.]